MGDFSIPIETTDVALPDTLIPASPDLGLTPTTSALSDTLIAPSGVNTAIDASGDEGYVDSAGLLGGGNSTSSNNPNETCPAQGSPVSSATSIGSTLENILQIGVAGAKIATAIEGPTVATPYGRTGQSSPVYGANQPSLLQRLFGQSAPVVGNKPSWWQSLFGATSGQVSGVNTASPTGAAGLVTIAVVGAVVLGLGFLVWRAVKV